VGCLADRSDPPACNIVKYIGGITGRERMKVFRHAGVGVTTDADVEISD
jgi:hypothetical protein